MAKIIIVNTSPRTGGNCDLIARRMAKRLGEGAHEVELVDFRNVAINHCMACDACKSKDEAWCVQKDDWSLLIPQIDACDAFALLTPIYFGDITSQARTVIDRFYPWFNPSHDGMSLAKRTGKRAAVLTTSGGSPVELGESRAQVWAGTLGIAGFTDTAVLSVNDVNRKGAIVALPEFLAHVDQVTDWLASA